MLEPVPPARAAGSHSGVPGCTANPPA